MVAGAVAGMSEHIVMFPVFSISFLVCVHTWCVLIMPLDRYHSNKNAAGHMSISKYCSCYWQSMHSLGCSSLILFSRLWAKKAFFVCTVASSQLLWVQFLLTLFILVFMSKCGNSQVLLWHYACLFTCPFRCDWAWPPSVSYCLQWCFCNYGTWFHHYSSRCCEAANANVWLSLQACALREVTSCCPHSFSVCVQKCRSLC